MATYSEDDYIPVNNAYNRVPSDLKSQANEILNSFGERYETNEAPPTDMVRALEALRSENLQGGLEQAMEHANSTSNSRWFGQTRAQSAAGLVLLIASIAALASGIPYVPLA